MLNNLINVTYLAYLNNILIYLDNLLEHKGYIAKVLKQLQESGLQIDIKKSEFAIILTKYLKLIISTNRLRKDLNKITTIHN